MYKLPNGRVFTLTAHGPAEWGERLAARLLQLRCSPEYAEKVAADYAAATRADAPVAA